MRTRMGAMQSVFLNVVDTAAGPEVTFRPDAVSFLDSLVSGLVTSPANELDGKISDALRNTLFGRGAGEDLVGRNIFRSRDVALPTYAGLAECFGVTPDAQVRPLMLSPKCPVQDTPSQHNNST